VAYCIVGNTIDRAHTSGGNGTGVNAEISFTLNTTDRHAVAVPFVASGYSVRRLTPLECERLQGFPDGWTEYGHDGKKISDSARYSALGNSVAIPCVEFIMGRITGGEKLK